MMFICYESGVSNLPIFSQFKCFKWLQAEIRDIKVNGVPINNLHYADHPDIIAGKVSHWQHKSNC